MKDLTSGLKAFEIQTTLIDADGYPLECYDSDTILCNQGDNYSYEQLIELADIKTPEDHNFKVEVYEVRWATLSMDRGGIDILEYDSSTGCNGSAVYEKTYCLVK